ncbi:response regulator [Brevundimonas sp.]|uniref:response regulator transcription factor n=1 Tax=Brevundimonas sp. TaxID=1871086 RepID=UPI0025C1B439|nr:response regulator [Brevundimonas sp.]
MEKGVVHIVDDDEAMRDSLAFLLEVRKYDYRVYSDAHTLLTRAPDLEQGCVVTDVRMPGLSGTELLRRLKAMGLPHPVIVITGHADVALAVEAMKAGAWDFLEKPFDDQIFVRLVEAALLIGEGDGLPPGGKPEWLARLSPRETDVLTGVASGKSNKEIARDLDISARTVEVYRANLMSKAGVRSLSDLMRMAVAAGY